MRPIDGWIVFVYLVLGLVLGLYLSRRGSRSLEDFFVSGRSLPWWLAGVSMAATTFSIDTPLYVAGLVATRGIAGNWEWWCFGVAHVFLVYVFARLWQRAGIITDAELTELRYGGRPAAWLRGVKAFLFAVPINAIGIGYAMLATVKVVEALEIWPSLGIDPGPGLKLWSVVGVSLLVLVYAGLAGLWGVVVTDFFQFFLAMVGAIVVATVAVNHVGGMSALVDQVRTQYGPEFLNFLPVQFTAGRWLWSSLAGISASTFWAYLLVQWWAFRRSDGGGEFIQRLAACRSESEAVRAAWGFNLLNYVLRTWPWVVVGLVALLLYPDLADRELGYPKLMLDFLGPGWLGLVVASLLAAFMSTVSTQINWGASYLTHDLYQRFLRPAASQRELVTAGRVASVIVTLLGAVAAFQAEDVGTVFRLVIAIGTGPGVVLILRWFWWRINAAAELAAMVAGFGVGLATSVVPVVQIEDFGERLMVTTLLTMAVWVPVMFLTPPENGPTLARFYTQVRPGGPGWRVQQQFTGLAPRQDLLLELRRVAAGLLLLYGLMFALGGFLLWQPWTGWIALISAAIGGVWLRRLHRVPASQ